MRTCSSRHTVPSDILFRGLRMRKDLKSWNVFLVSTYGKLEKKMLHWQLSQTRAAIWCSVTPNFTFLVLFETWKWQKKIGSMYCLVLFEVDLLCYVWWYFLGGSLVKLKNLVLFQRRFGAKIFLTWQPCSKPFQCSFICQTSRKQSSNLGLQHHLCHHGGTEPSTAYLWSSHPEFPGSSKPPGYAQGNDRAKAKAWASFPPFVFL